MRRHPWWSFFLALSLLPFLLNRAAATWPLTPLTTYVPATTPWIKAGDLNSIQGAIVGLFTGGLTVKGITVDGTGGAIQISPPSGSIYVNRSVAGSSVPLASVAPTELVGAAHAQCWGILNSAGTLYRGENIYSISHTATSGVYVITCNAVLSNVLYGSVIATLYNPPGPEMVAANTGSGAGGRLKVTVNVFDTSSGSAALADDSFQFVAFGE